MADFRVGFLVRTPEEVCALHSRIRAAGVETSDVLESARGGMLYCRSPEGFIVEVSWRPASAS